MVTYLGTSPSFCGTSYRNNHPDHSQSQARTAIVTCRASQDSPQIAERHYGGSWAEGQGKRGRKLPVVGEAEVLPENDAS